MAVSKRDGTPYVVPIAVFYVFLWASAFVPSKIAATESNPYWFLAVRLACGGAFLALLAVALQRPFPHTARGWAAAAVLGVLANAGYLGLTYTAMHHLSSGMGAIVASTNPLLLALVAPWLLGEKLDRMKSLGLAIGFAGVVWIMFARSGTGTAVPSDVALAFLGVCASVASTIVFKRAGVQEDLLSLNAVALVAAAAVMAPIAYATSGFGRVVVTRELAEAFVYLVLVNSVAASLVWFWLLGRGEASRVSAFYYLTPAFGLALSAVFLREPVTLLDAGGLVAIAAGIAIVQRS